MEALPLALPVVPVHITHRHIFRRVIIIFSGALLVAATVFFIQPKPQLSSIDSHGFQPIDKALTVEFQWPVARTVDFRIAPYVEGQVTYANALVKNRLVRTLVFTPTSTWEPGQTYSVSLVGVASATSFYSRQSEYNFSITTTPAPSVASITPNQNNAITADGGWTIVFDRPLTNAFSIVARTIPSSELSVIYSTDGKSVTLQPQQLLGQGKQYLLVVERVARRYNFGTTEVDHEEAPKELINGTWFVREPPGIKSVSPTGIGVTLDAVIDVVFDEPVDLAMVKDYASIEPSTEGNWSQIDDNSLRFTPVASLQRSTTYTLTLREGLKTKVGGIFDSNERMQFRTREPIAFSSTSPFSEAKGIDVNRQLRVTFNQPVNHDEVLRNIKISPSIEGTWSWSNDVLVFTPKGHYAFETKYKITVSKNISAISGFSPEADLTFVFTTELSTTHLAVPFHRQEHKLSCEIATLVMALRFKGINIGEQTIIDLIGFDPTPKKDGVWGDPDKAFVGDIDGQQPGTGYGVYAQPIADAGSKYRTTRVMSGAELAEILNEVKAGNPVIVWGNASTGKRVDWKTTTGKTIRAIVGEHTRVVIGFKGSASQPTTIITLDPLFGEKHFSRSAFLSDWELLGNMAVVVE